MLGASLKTTTVTRCSVLATVVMRVKADLLLAATVARQAMAALPRVATPQVAATINRHATVPLKGGSGSSRRRALVKREVEYG